MMHGATVAAAAFIAIALFATECAASGPPAGTDPASGGSFAERFDHAPLTASRVDVHVDLAVPVYSAGRHEVVVTGSVHAASGRYTQTFYGVTDAQAAATRFAPYSTKGGIDSASMSVAWTYKFSKHWSVDTTLGLTRLLGRYGNSPIVQQKANYFGLSSLTYRF